MPIVSSRTLTAALTPRCGCGTVLVRLGESTPTPIGAHPQMQRRHEKPHGLYGCECGSLFEHVPLCGLRLIGVKDS